MDSYQVNMEVKYIYVCIYVSHMIIKTIEETKKTEK